MAFRDLREFLRALEMRGLLRRVRAPVSTDLEITEINDRVVKSGGPALLFENVEGHSVPVAINLFGTKERMAIALGVDDLDALPQKFGRLIELAMTPPTGGFIEKLKLLPTLFDLSRTLPKVVSDAPCKEVVLEGDRVDLGRFPILKCWPQDAGRFITFPLVFTHDPETGRRNVGTYRMQVYDRRTTAMHFHPHKDGARHFRKARGRLEAAVAIGADPATCFAATLPLPPDVDEILVAGLLRGEGVRTVRCDTVEIEVPAEAEIVLEGWLDPKERRVEGPFGDHTGYYSLEDEFPVFHVERITHRRDPIYHTIVVGPPPQEDGFIGYAIERLFLPLLRLHLPEVVDYHMPMEGIFHNLMIVSIRKQYPGHARRVMHAIWGLPQAMFTKVIVVVDEDVDVRNPREVVWKALNHIDPERDIEFVMGPVDILDHASRLPGLGSHMGVDATRKWPGEGFDRRWPDEIRMSPEVRALVDRKWREYGL
jgi:4-hydroxy-3-polyprenylbenzoate decarboxylase